MKKLTAFVLLAGLLCPAPSAFAVDPPVQVTTLQLPDLVTPEQAAEVENQLKELPGVTAVKASVAIEAVVVVYDPVKASADQFIDSLQETGYIATFAKANYRCPKCTATYSDDGNCIVDDTPLEPVGKA